MDMLWKTDNHIYLFLSFTNLVL